MKVLKRIGASLVIFVLLFGICNVTPIKAAELGNNRAITEAISKFKNQSKYYRDCIIDEAYCTHLRTISKVPETRTSEWTTYKYTYEYTVAIGFHSPEDTTRDNEIIIDTFSTLVTEYEKNPEIKHNYRMKEKDNSNNQDNPFKDTSTDYEKSIGEPPLPDTTTEATKSIGEPPLPDTTTEATKSIGEPPLPDTNTETTKSIGEPPLPDTTTETTKSIGEPPLPDTNTETTKSIGEPPLPNETAEETEEVTVSATKIESKMQKGGALYVNITLSEPIKVIKAPILKVKIGEQTRSLAYNSQTNTSLIYKTTINNVENCGKDIVFESLKGGKVECQSSNTISTMDYESKLTNKNLGKIENFILVEKDSLGDINKDLRIDNLDVEAITNCKDKNIADVNGDGKINELDKSDLKKAIENKSLKYIRFIKTSEFKKDNNIYIHGDVTDSTGSGTPDGIINYHDAEYLKNNLTKISTDKGDVNGDGKVNDEDVVFINTAISNQNPIYLLYLKVEKNNFADVYPSQGDGVINAKDIFEIESLKNENAKKDDKGNINKDNKIDLYDQIALSQMLYQNDVTKTKFLKVYVGSKGDVNKDGFIDYYDAQKIAAYILPNSNINLDLDIADVNGNGEIDLYDSIMIQKALEEQDNVMTEKAALLSNSYFIVPEDDLLGDVNGDHFINYYDAKAIAEYMINNDASKLDISKADVNKDGKVDIYDAIDISKQLQGLYDKSITYKQMEKEDGETFDFEYLPGDVNQDGAVDIADLVALNKHLLNSEENPLIEEQLKAADVAYDSNVNATDSAMLVNYIAELITNIPL